MKDYSLSEESAKRYILSYEKKNNKLTAKLASGENYVIPSTDENEKKLDSRMEKQVRDAKVKTPSIMNFILAVTQPLVLPLAISNFIQQPSGLTLGVLAIMIGSSILYPGTVINYLVNKHHLKKYNYYLDNKEDFSKENIKTNNITYGVSKKATKELSKVKDSKPVNLSNIDNYTLKDLITLRDNIKRYREFGFQEEAPSEDNPMTLRRR